MDSSAIGRVLVVLGLILVAAGLALWLLPRIGVPLGRLPGDVTWSRGSTRIAFPIVTCLLLSIALTIAINVVLRLLRR